MRFNNIVALCGFILFATLSLQVSAVSMGSYYLGNHPDGAKNPPPYGSWLDGLLGYGVYTFDFEHASSDMRLDRNGTAVHIYGTALGGEDNGNNVSPGYAPGTTAVWSIDITFDTGISTVANGGMDDVVVGDSGHHANSGTLSSSFGDFDLRSHSDGSSTFHLGDEAGAGHRGFAGISGWLDYRSVGGNTWAGSDGGCCSDWLLTMTPVSVPDVAWLFGSGLIGLICVARRPV